MIWIFLFINIIAHWKIFLLPGQLAYGDLSTFPENFSQVFINFFYVWKNLTFGLDRSSGNIFDVIQGIFLIIFRSGEISQKIYLFLIPLISFLTFKFLLEKDLNIKNKFVIFISSLFYSFSPIFFQESQGGSQYSTILFFSLFPILFYFTFRIIERPTIKRIFLFSILFGVITSIYSQIIFIFTVAILLPVSLELIISKFRSYKGILSLILAGILSFFFNPYYYLDSLNLVSTKTSSGELTSFASRFDYFNSILPITYKGTSLLNTLRLGNCLSLSYEQAHWYTIIFLLIVFSVLILSVLYIIKNKPTNKYFLYSLVSYIFFVLFAWLATKTSLIKIYAKIPLMYMFRNPAKLTYITTFYFSLLFAFTYNFLLKKIKKLYIKYLILVPTYLIVFIYLWPIFTGDGDLSKNRQLYYILPEIKDIVHNVNIDRANSEGRTFWVPSSHEDTSIKLQWLDRNKLEAQLGMTDFGGEYYEYAAYVGIIYSLRNNDLNALQNIFKLTQVKYIPLLKESRYFEKQIINYNASKEMLSNFQKIADTEKYDIYKNDNIVNEIYSPQTLITTNASSTDYSIVASLLDQNANDGIIFSNHIKNNQIPYSILFNFLPINPELSPYTNMVIDPDWVYPQKNDYIEDTNDYLNRLKNVEKEKYLRAYLMRISDNFVILGQLINDPKITTKDETNIISYYNELLTDLNFTINQIPIEQRDVEFLSTLRKPMLYLDESIHSISNKINLSKEIVDNYESFKIYIKNLENSTCSGNFCFNFALASDQDVDTKIYRLHNKVEATEVLLNGSKINNISYYPYNSLWLDLGKLKLKKGDNQIVLKQQMNVENSISYELGENYIKLTGLKTPNTYKISFLYDLKDNDTQLSLTENYPSQDFEINNKKIFLAKISRSVSNDFCYQVQDNECYRRFSYSYNPNNDANSLYINFSENFNDSFKIDNISAIEYNEPVLAFIINRDKTYASPELKYKKINPTKYNVEVSNSTGSYILVLNQSYNDNWELHINDNLRRPLIDERNHFIINGYANAWLINPQDAENKSSYQISIIYNKQKIYYLNLLLMAVYLIGGGYIISKDYLIPMIKNKKNKKKNER